MATHVVKPLPYANDALKGIGSKTIEIHHDKLYAGYVNKRNEIEEALAKVDRSKANQIYSDMRGMKHEETFAANGQILHEIYFAVMGGDGQPKGEVVDKLKEDFGTFAAWKRISRHRACAPGAGSSSPSIRPTAVSTTSSETLRTRAASGAPSPC